MKSYSHFVSVSDSSSFSLGHKVIPENAIGGFFVSPVNISIGSVRFDLMGLLSKNEEEWGIVLLDIPGETLGLTPDKPKLVPAGKQQKTSEELRKYLESKNGKTQGKKNKKLKK